MRPSLLLLLPCLLSIWSAGAQPSINCADTLEVRSPQDLATIHACTAIGGFVIRGENAAGLPNTVDLSDLSVHGDVSVTNSSITSFVGPRQLGGGLEFSYNHACSNVAIAPSTSNATLSWHHLRIVDNPLITSLSGVESLINLSTDLLVASNPGLSKLEFPVLAQAGDVHIASNSEATKFSFAELESAKSIRLTSVAEVSAPKLAAVSGDLAISFSGVQKLSLPSLTSTGPLSIDDNPSLTTVDLPKLETINGDLFLRNNPRLGGNRASSTSTMVRRDLDVAGVDMPALVKVVGSLRLEDSNTEIKMPALHEVQGAVNMIAPEDVCKNLRSVVQGEISCQGSSNSTNIPHHVVNGTSGDTNSSGNSTNGTPSSSSPSASPGSNGGSGHGSSASDATPQLASFAGHLTTMVVVIAASLLL